MFWRSLAGEVFVQYESALRNGNTNSVSNFTKGDETYRGQILNELLKMTYILLRHHAGVRMLRRSLTLLFNVAAS